MQGINRAIELLEPDQPIYYTGVHELSYASGKEAAQTWADYLMVEMEHYSFDIDEGVRVTAGGPETAEIGRKYTGWTMPW